MKLSKALRSRREEFKLSKRSIALLKKFGIKSIGLHNGSCGKKYVYVTIKCQKKLLHRFLMQILGHEIDGIEIDHRNGNGLDNRLNNLRLATRRQNCGNMSIPSVNTTGFKGIYFHRVNKRWVANIGRPTEYIGSYSTKIEAARAYNAAAKKRYGKFAKLNEIPK